MKTQRRRLRKSEWVILLAPVLVLAVSWIVVRVRDTWTRRYTPVTLALPATNPNFNALRVKSLTFSPDGRYLAVSQWSGNYIISLWDCQTEQQLWKATFQSMTWLPQFSPEQQANWHL